MLPNAMARKPMVMALDTPVTDQPVSRAMGCSRTGSENIDSDRDAAQKAARRNDHPSVARFGHSVPYQLVGILVKSHSNEAMETPERMRDARKRANSDRRA